MEMKPKRTPIILLNISALIVLIGNIFLWVVSHLGDNFTATDEKAQALDKSVAGYFVIGELIYFIFCLAIMVFWALRKHWAKWGILSLVCIHLSGIFVTLITYHIGFYLIYDLSSLNLFRFLFSIYPVLWYGPMILDLVVLYQIFGPIKALIKIS
jgi:hypothetical protein